MPIKQLTNGMRETRVSRTGFNYLLDIDSIVKSKNSQWDHQAHTKLLVRSSPLVQVKSLQAVFCNLLDKRNSYSATSKQY